MSNRNEYVVTVHVEPDCSPETLLALNEMVKCLIKHMEQRSPTLREAERAGADGLQTCGNGNCDAYREVKNGVIEKCKNCGDPEIDLDAVADVIP